MASEPRRAGAARSGDPLAVDLSSVVYRGLLAAYPAPFRAEYALWMEQIFRDQCLRAYRASGPAALPSLWASTLLDWSKTVVEQRVMKGLTMSRSAFISASGWCLIVSVIALMLGLASAALYSGTTDPLNLLYRPYDPWLNAGQLAAFPAWALLTALGLAGLYARFGSQTGLAGRAALALGTLGGVAASASFALLALAGENEPPGVWAVAMLGLLAMFGGLAVFGLAVLRVRVLAGWNWLPLATGVCFIAGMVVSSVLGAQMWSMVTVLVFGLTSAGMLLLGRLLLREPAVAAVEV